MVLSCSLSHSRIYLILALNLTCIIIGKLHRFRQLPCRTYISTGYCPYKDRCVYVHDPRITSSADISRFKNRKKNKEDICSDSFFWPILPILLNENDKSNSVMTEYFVPSPNNDKYYMHDSASFSMWNNFVDICHHITLKDNTQHLSGYNHAKARREMCNLSTKMLDNTDTNRFVSNLPRLSVFRTLSNGESYCSDSVLTPENNMKRGEELEYACSIDLPGCFHKYPKVRTNQDTPIALPPKILILPTPPDILFETAHNIAMDDLENAKLLSAGARPFTPIVVNTKSSDNDKTIAISPTGVNHGFSPTTITTNINIEIRNDRGEENREQLSPFGSYFDTGIPPIENEISLENVSFNSEASLVFPSIAVDNSENSCPISIMEKGSYVNDNDKEKEFLFGFHGMEQSLLQGVEFTERDNDLVLPKVSDCSKEDLSKRFNNNCILPMSLDLEFMKESEYEEEELFEIQQLASKFKSSNSSACFNDTILKKEVPPGLGIYRMREDDEQMLSSCIITQDDGNFGLGLNVSNKKREEKNIAMNFSENKTFMSLSDSQGTLRHHEDGTNSLNKINLFKEEDLIQLNLLLS